jgi:hypothetical protein
MLPGQDPEMVDQIQQVLIGSRAGIYQRGDQLVRTARLESVLGEDLEDDGIIRPRGSLVITRVTEPWLNETFMRYATWVRSTKQREQLSQAELDEQEAHPQPGRKRKWKVTDGWTPDRPEYQYAKALLNREGEWRFPVLKTISETPVFLSDGRVLTQPGYDAASGVIFDPPPGVRWEHVPDQPTREQVDRAVADLYEPVDEFPFRHATDRAAYLASILSVLGRAAVDGPVPLFASLAPTPGTGKTKIVEVSGVISTGHVPAVTTLSDDAEMRKRITSVLLAGSPLVLIDNVSGAIGSDVLDSLMSARRWKDRILGMSKEADMPALTVWFMSGNNLGFRKTLARRVVPINLDSGEERPEDRTFKRADLIGWVLTHRVRLVNAALTILRAYHVAGRPARPGGEPAMGSFEAWDAVVRGAVTWATGVDPASTGDPDTGRGKLRISADIEADDLSVLVKELAIAYPGMKWTVLEAVNQAKGKLKDVLDQMCGFKGHEATPRDLAYKLRGIVDRPFGGLTVKLQPRKNSRDENRWYIEGSEATVSEPGLDF